MRRGLEIRPIAEELRIGSRYLEAIESEEWGQLPGGFFNRSFVRQYAQALGLDGQKFELEYAQLLKPESSVDMDAMRAARDPRARLDEERKLISIKPVVEPHTSFFDGRTGLAVAAMVALIGVGGAISLVWDNVRGTDAQPVAAASTQSGPRPVVPARPRPEAAAPAGEAAVVQQPAATSGGEPGVLSLNIAATEKTWIEVTADGKKIFVGVLEAGQVQQVSTSQQARMVVGNAGGITVMNDGKDIGPIGPRGQVRVVKVTKDQVEISEPKQPAPKAVGEV